MRMITDENAEPPHAGEIISDIMEDLDIGIRELARALAIAPSTASRMVSGITAVTPEMAIRLAAVLAVPQRCGFASRLPMTLTGRLKQWIYPC